MDQVAQIREKIDLPALIAQHIPLKKAGRNFKGLCPFHGEKTPSFVVSPERQIWHCFGCSKGGDCFTFVMEYERIEFPEALRVLAKVAGIELVSSQFERGLSSKKEELYKVNRLAAEFYHYVLVSHKAGQKALLYVMKKRNIHEKLLETFLLGLAPAGNGLTKYLIEKKKYKQETLLDAGLSTYRNGKVSDFFSNRLMFPLIDHRDNVVGFSGRLMDDNDSFSPKYVNTKDTLVYHKGEGFFGLNIAKQEIKKQNAALVMEGEFDVMSCFQEGITNGIAIKGTALTDSQARLLARFCQKVNLCFDQDSAGQQALKRSIAPLEAHGLTIAAVVLSGAKDPDEAIQKDPTLMKQAVKNAVGIYDYLIENAGETFDKNTAEGKRAISSDLLPFISAIENEIVKEHYFKQLAKLLDTSIESITKQASRTTKKEQQVPSTQAIKQRPREEILEEYLFALILQHANVKQILSEALLVLPKTSLTTPSYQKLLEKLTHYFSAKEVFDSSEFEKALPQELTHVFDTSFLFPLPGFSSEPLYNVEVKRVARELHMLFLKRKIRDISQQMKATSSSDANKEEMLVALKRELDLLTPFLHS